MNGRVYLSSGSLSNYGLDRVFELARSAGFDGVELIVDGRTDSVHPDYLKKLMIRHSLPISAVHSPFSFIDPPGWEKDEISRVKRSIALAEELGAGLLVLHSPFFTDHAYRRWLENDLRETQAATSVVVAVENMPHSRKLGGVLGVWLGWPSLQEAGAGRWWRLLPSFLRPPCFPLSALAALERFPHIVLDTTHLGTGGLDPIKVFNRLGERVAHVHLSNFDGREHIELRKGRLDLEGFLRHLSERGYHGSCCLEIIPEYFSSHDERFTFELLKANLELIRRNLSSASPPGAG
jgi:sugar phosphate isomerase/epimerase